jgi:4-amino-4-deoxy-L-arabinose transferase-like glycosyltransferase
VTRRGIDGIFLLILLAAALARVYLAATTSYIHDEENTSIPLSQQISFAPGSRYLPLRAVNHPALPAYFVKAGSAVTNTSPLGYRWAHVVLGLCAVLLVYLLTRQAYGPVAGRWAAVLMAFNEYFLTISARATAHGPYLLFVTATLHAFSRALLTGRAVYLYVAGGAAALAFYCKEHAVLLLPALFLVLLLPRHRDWLRRAHPYAACALFALLIAPDVLWNLRANPDVDRVTYGNRAAPQATYASHFKRIGGLGLSPYPLMFYARQPVSALSELLTGGPLDDNTPEYRSMNPALGVLLLGAVLLTTLRSAGPDTLRGFLLLAFWCTFGFFLSIRRGDSPGLDPVSWIWVDATMVPAAVMAGARMAEASGRGRLALWSGAGLAAAYSIFVSLAG